MPRPPQAAQSNSQPRVLFVNTRSVAGADVAVHLSLIQHLGAQGIDVHVATNRNAIDFAQTLEILKSVAGLKPLALDLGRETAGSGGNLAAKSTNALRNVGAAVSLARLAVYIRKHRIDFVHVTDRPRDALFATALVRMGVCKSIVHVHNKWNDGIGRAAMLAVKHCTRIIAISQFTRCSMLDGGLPDAKVAVCHNATDTTRFDPLRVMRGELRSRLNLKPDTPLIGIVARIMLWKGHQELIEAMRLVKTAVPNAHLAIIGRTVDMPPYGGQEFERGLRQRISELNLEDCVHWSGWHDDMPGIMADLDILAVPSWEEPFGLVVTEALAMQTPVVGFASGALPEIIENGTEGLLTPARNTDALADALIALLQDSSRREEMGKRGRERVLAQFTPQQQAQRMADIYRQALGRQ